MDIMLDNLTICEGAMEKRHIGYMVKSLNRRLNQVLSNIPAIRENETLTGIKTWVLHFLFRNTDRDIFQRDVEAEFKIRRSTATELLKAMERGGLICRVPVEYDARLKKIVLTEYAQEIRKQIGAQIERAEAQMTEGFTQEELERFFGYIDRMCANLEKCE